MPADAGPANQGESRNDALPPGTIVTADAAQLVDASSQAILAALNARAHEPAYLPWVIGVGSAIALGLGGVVHPVMTPIAALLVAAIGHPVHLADKDRRSFGMAYHLEEHQRRFWSELCNALLGLAGSHRLWRVEARTYTGDDKHQAGAGTLCGRTSASCRRQVPAVIVSNVTPFCLATSGQELYFMPDRVYVWQHGTFGAIDYQDLTVEVSRTQFVESDTVPRDALIVGRTWQYVNRDGGPDRRFAHNPERTVCMYGQVSIRSATGLHLLLHASSASAAEAAVEVLRRALSELQGSSKQSPPSGGRGASNAARHGQADAGARAPQQPSGSRTTSASSGSRSTPRPASPGSPGPNRAQSPPHFADHAPHQPQPGLSLVDCCRILGLAPSCSAEDAKAQYRELVRQYHPDQVARLAPEIRERAGRRMREINSAYRALKTLRGWP